jgi:hypothetical protein
VGLDVGKNKAFPQVVGLLDWRKGHARNFQVQSRDIELR